MSRWMSRCLDGWMLLVVVVFLGLASEVVMSLRVIKVGIP